MKNFRNNYRRNRYKNYTDRGSKKINNGIKTIDDMQNGSMFVRNNSGRNNHNAPKLIEKYSSLAREALSNGDKILSESYFQYAEHFIRVLGQKNDLLNKNQIIKDNTKVNDQSIDKTPDQESKSIDEINSESINNITTSEN
tara:strand:+ start:700 stop:1122 length:423 start_codon:yes stop_codon:yes gene_type:complete